MSALLIRCAEHIGKGQRLPFEADVDVGIRAPRLPGGGHHLAVAAHSIKDHRRLYVQAGPASEFIVNGQSALSDGVCPGLAWGSGNIGGSRSTPPGSGA